MTRPFLVFENLDTVSRHELFRVFGTRWVATHFAWLSPVFWCALGLVVAFLGDPNAALSDHGLFGIGYGLMLMAANTIHSIGHIIAGRLSGAPMAVNLLTATRDVSVYVKQGPDAGRSARAVFRRSSWSVIADKMQQKSRMGELHESRVGRNGEKSATFWARISFGTLLAHKPEKRTADQQTAVS